MIVDAAHNAASIASLLSTLDESFSARKRWLIFATTQDKQIREMLGQLLPRFRRDNCSRAISIIRAMCRSPILRRIAADVAKGCWGPGARASSVAIRRPRRGNRFATAQRADDLICITGSFFLAAEMRRIVPGSPPHLNAVQGDRYFHPASPRKAVLHVLDALARERLDAGRVVEDFDGDPALVVDVAQGSEDRQEIHIAKAGALPVGVVGVEVVQERAVRADQIGDRRRFARHRLYIEVQPAMGRADHFAQLDPFGGR